MLIITNQVLHVDCLVEPIYKVYNNYTWYIQHPIVRTIYLYWQQKTNGVKSNTLHKKEDIDINPFHSVMALKTKSHYSQQQFIVSTTNIWVTLLQWENENLKDHQCFIDEVTNSYLHRLLREARFFLLWSTWNAKIKKSF